MDCLVSIGSLIAGCLAAPIGRHFGYLVSYGSNVNGLRDQLSKLRDDRDAIQQFVEAAKRKGDQILPNVERWLTSVGEIIEEAENFLNNEVQANQRCFSLLPFLDLKSRYQVSREAATKTLRVEMLLKHDKLVPVSCSPLPPPLASMFSGDSEIFCSRSPTFDKIMEALRDESVNVIGVFGMGGVGKTTLAQQVAKQAEKDKLFDSIIFTAVSQKQNLHKIEGDVAEMLKLELKEENIHVRAGRILERLKHEKRFLIIFDDMWEGLELETIGIPHSSMHKGCNVLLTCRNRPVCVEMNAQVSLPIEVLSEQEAWQLFKKKAGDVVESPHLRAVAIDVSKECAGLPLAIVTVATALKHKNNEHGWNNALIQLRNPSQKSTKGIYAKIFSCLQLSNEFLESKEHEYFFLLCCLFPEDFDIAIETLVKYGIGLKLFEGVREVEAARKRASTLVDDLKDRCLLLDGARLDESVRMHDTVRDFAIFTASRGEHNFFVKTVSELKECYKDDAPACHTAISLFGDCVDGLPDFIDCPKLQIFVSRQEDRSLGRRNVPSTFFDAAKSLKVLDLSYHAIPSIPVIHCLTNLRTLCLEHCVLEDVSQIGKLEGLEILSFLGSDIIRLPREIGRLTQLRLLDLRSNYLMEISAGVLASFSKMECLYVDFDKWEADVQGVERHNASLVELNSMSRSLNDLQIRLDSVELYPEDLIFRKLEKFIIHVGKPFDNRSAQELNLCAKSLIIQFPRSGSLEGRFATLCATVQFLVLRGVEDLSDVLYDLSREGFSNLQNLTIGECDGIEFLVSMTNDDYEIQSSVVFEALKGLKLERLKELIGISRGDIPFGSFRNLKCVRITGCEKMKYLFTQTDDIILLPELEELHFADLPNLRSFCGAMNAAVSLAADSNVAPTHEPLFNGKVGLPALRRLSLDYLSNTKEIWHPQFLPLQSFGRLNKISIKSCNELRVLIPFNLVQRLQCLEEFDISDCEMLEEVWEASEEGPSCVGVDEEGRPNTFKRFAEIKAGTVEVDFLACGIWDR